MNARTIAALAAATCLVLFAPLPATAAENPFSGLAGSWSGSGKITVNNGSSERIRCRGNYRSQGTGLSLSLRCASDSYKFELASDFTYDGGGISGSWNETTRSIFGQLNGRATAGRIQATASAVGFSASILISTHGNSQTVSIRSPGSEISEVSITMARAGR